MGIFSFSVARKDRYDYPLIVLREAVVNAVTHRDYGYDSSHIYVHMYPNYIEIENPGGLYHGLTEDQLEKRSVRRNRLIADLLHRAGYIERVGSGFDRMNVALEENNNPPFELSVTNFFNIRFYKRIQSKIGELTLRQIELCRLFETHQRLTKQQAATLLRVSNDTALREISVLLQTKFIIKQGTGRATVYVLNK